MRRTHWLTTVRRLAVAAIAAAALVGCSGTPDGPPAIEVDKTSCSHCGMLVSEPVYAAAYQAPGDAPRVFDDIKCLADAAAREPRVAETRFWFHDAATGEWIAGENAAFVESSTLRTPMAGGLLAFGTTAAAKEAAAKHRGTVINSLQDLLNRGTS